MVIQLYYVILLRKCCRLGTTIYPYCRKPFWTQPASRQLMLLAVVMWRLMLGSQQFTSSWGTKWLLYDWRSCTSVWDFGGTWCDLSESWPLFFCGALVSQPQVCSWNEPLRLADKQSFDFCGQLRNNYASDSGGVLPLVRSQQCAWRGVFIASFLFRHSTDATSLVFEDCLFEANSVGGVGGGAGHITGTVWVSELQLVAGSPELVTDVLLRQQLGPTLSTSAGLLGKVPWLAKAQTWTVAETSVQEVQRQTIKKANSAVTFISTLREGGALRLEVPSTVQIDFFDVIFRNNTALSSSDIWADLSQSTTINVHFVCKVRAPAVFLPASCWLPWPISAGCFHVVVPH